MQNQSTSARTAAKYGSKCSLLFRQAPILAILMLCAVFCQAQILFGGNDCGTWKTDTSYSEWETIDTVGKLKISTKNRNWVYNNKDEPLESNNQTTLLYCPCGCPFTSRYWQYRICKITGIRQKRLKENYTRLIPPPPPPKTEYQKVIDSLGVSK